MSWCISFNWVYCYTSIMLLMYPCNKYAKFSYKKKPVKSICRTCWAAVAGKKLSCTCRENELRGRWINVEATLVSKGQCCKAARINCKSTSSASKTNADSRQKKEKRLWSVGAAIHCRQLVCQGDMGVNTDYTSTAQLVRQRVATCRARVGLTITWCLRGRSRNRARWQWKTNWTC